MAHMYTIYCLAYLPIGTMVVVSLGNALHVGSKSCLHEFTELNFLSVGSQLPPKDIK